MCYIAVGGSLWGGEKDGKMLATLVGLASDNMLEVITSSSGKFERCLLDTPPPDNLI